MTHLGYRPGLPMWAKILMPLLMLAVLGGGVAAWLLSGGPAGGGKYTLTVKSGDTLASVARDLQEHKIVRSADALRYEMRRAGTDSSLQEGTYDLSGEMSLSEVAQALAAPPRIPTVRVVIPEGRRIKDLPAIFAKAGFKADGIEKALNDPSLSEYAEYNLEGFVFPATYEFREDAAAQDLSLIHI